MCQVVGKETTEKLRLAVRCYFFFVKQEVPRLNLHRFADQNLFIVCYTDASKDLLCFSISVITRTCLDGKVQSQATHFATHAYTVHAQIVNILQCESLALLKCLTELGVYLVEIDRMGKKIPRENKYVFVDSQILLHLIRWRTTGIKSKFKHLVSKIQIKMFDLSISPLLQVAYVNQRQTIHYGDVLSKFEKYDYDKITQQYERLWNLSPLLASHPKYLPGAHFDLCVPSKDEQEFLESHVCETGESENVISEISSNSKPDIAVLSMSARKYLENNDVHVMMGEGGSKCAGENLVAQCERDLKEYMNEEEESSIGREGGISSGNDMISSRNDAISSRNDAISSSIDKISSRGGDWGRKEICSQPHLSPLHITCPRLLDVVNTSSLEGFFDLIYIKFFDTIHISAFDRNNATM